MLLKHMPEWVIEIKIRSIIKLIIRSLDSYKDVAILMLHSPESK